jgi:hypothetical protein
LISRKEAFRRILVKATLRRYSRGMQQVLLSGLLSLALLALAGLLLRPAR